MQLQSIITDIFRRFCCASSARWGLFPLLRRAHAQLQSIITDIVRRFRRASTLRWRLFLLLPRAHVQLQRIVTDIFRRFWCPSNLRWILFLLLELYLVRGVRPVDPLAFGSRELGLCAPRFSLPIDPAGQQPQEQ
jgi:hypothetical protein